MSVCLFYLGFVLTLYLGKIFSNGMLVLLSSMAESYLL